MYKYIEHFYVLLKHSMMIYEVRVLFYIIPKMSLALIPLP